MADLRTNMGYKLDPYATMHGQDLKELQQREDAGWNPLARIMHSLKSNFSSNRDSVAERQQALNSKLQAGLGAEAFAELMQAGVVPNSGHLTDFVRKANAAKVKGERDHAIDLIDAGNRPAQTQADAQRQLVEYNFINAGADRQLERDGMEAQYNLANRGLGVQEQQVSNNFTLGQGQLANQRQGITNQNDQFYAGLDASSAHNQMIMDLYSNQMAKDEARYQREMDFYEDQVRNQGGGLGFLGRLFGG
jgi:hypothetical protein